jgi:DNA-binding MarR family transcriptional regulator
MNNKTDREEQLTLELLDAVEKRNDLNQRHLARQMGVALGLANSYLRRCIRKGWVKVGEAPAHRYLYYLTPKGLTEKTRLTAKYLSNSFAFYRKAGESCERLFQDCVSNDWRRVLLCGVSDLAEIAALRALDQGMEVLGTYDPQAVRNRFVSKPVWRELADAAAPDVWLVTDLAMPQMMYDRLTAQLGAAERIMVPDILGLPGR